MLATLTVASGLGATTFIVTDTADMVDASDVVVVGRVDAIRSIDQDNALRTTIGITVEDTLKGTPAGRLDIVEPGGVVGNRRRWIQGAPTFFVGERVVLFLRQNARRELETSFLGMGKFRVARSSSGVDFVVRNLGDARVLHPSNGGLAAAPQVTWETLDQFRRRVRATKGTRTPRQLFRLEVGTPRGSRWQDNFTFAGPPLTRWFEPDTGTPVRYLISNDGDATLGRSSTAQAADAALAAWSNAPCSNLNLIDDGFADPTPFTTCDGQTEITFNDPFAEVPDPVRCTGVLAIGGVCADGSAVENFDGAPFYPITEGDVVVNNGFGSCPFWTSQNLAELLTHEVGHTLGLAHSSEDPSEPDPSLRDATMYYAAHFDGRGAALMSDDLAAVCALYPAGRTGSVVFRRFAIVSVPSRPAPSDRLVVDGMLHFDGTDFHPGTDTLIMDLLAAGASVFRLAILPGQMKASPSGTRYWYRGDTKGETTELKLSMKEPGVLRFHLRARGLDLSGAETDPVVMSLAFGAAIVTQPVGDLRSSARGRFYP